MEIDYSIYIILTLSLIASFIHGISGFGSAIIFHLVWAFLGLFELSIDTSTTRATAIILIITIVTCPLCIYHSGIKSIVYHQWLLLTIGMTIFPYVGTLLLITLDILLIKSILGIIFIVFAFIRFTQLIFSNENENEDDKDEIDIILEELYTTEDDDSNNNNINHFQYISPKYLKAWIPPGVSLTIFALFSGSLSGLLNGLYGTGGPPVMLYFAIIPLTKQQIRGTYSSSDIIGLFPRLLLMIFYNIFNSEDMLIYILLVPFSFFGFFIGNYLHNRINKTTILYFLVILMVTGSIPLIGILNYDILFTTYWIIIVILICLLLLIGNILVVLKLFFNKKFLNIQKLLKMYFKYK